MPQPCGIYHICVFLVKGTPLDGFVSLSSTSEFIASFSHPDPLNLNVTSHLPPGSRQPVPGNDKAPILFADITLIYKVVTYCSS